MRPTTSRVVLLLSSLSLVQAAAHRRDGLLGKLRMRGQELDKRQDQAQTVTVVQTVTVGAADAGIVANNTVTVTVTEACQPGAVNGAASSGLNSVDASATVPAVGSVASAPGAAVPGAQQQPSGGIGVVIVDIPSSLRTPTRVGTPPPATSAAAVVPPAASAPAAGASSLAPLPGSSAAAGSSLQPLPSAGASSAGGLQPLPSAAPAAGAPAAGSSLAPLPSAGLASSAAASSLAPLPSAGAGAASSLAPLPSAGPASALQPLPPVASASNLAPLPSLAAPSAAPSAAPVAAPSAAPAAPVDPALIPPGGIAAPADGATPVANPDGSFGGQAGVIPIGEAGNPQAVVDPTVTQTPGVANAGAQVVNIDVSNLTLNSQLNLGNLVQATPAPVI